MMHPLERVRPFRGPGAFVSLVLRCYLALFLAGCAATRPAPTPEQIHARQTRTIEAGTSRTTQALVTALQDMSFTIDGTDESAGVVVAHRDSREDLAEISREISPEATPGEKKGMPTWAKVALIATGAIVVVAVLAAVSSHDNDDDAGKDKKADQAGGKGEQWSRGDHGGKGGGDEAARPTDDQGNGKPGGRPATKPGGKPGDKPGDKPDDRSDNHGNGSQDRRDGRQPHPSRDGDHQMRPSRDHRHGHEDHGGVDWGVILVGGEEPSPPAVYHYEVTVSLKSLGGRQTEVRASGQGSVSRGGSVDDAGPIYDEGFYAGLFNRLNLALTVASTEGD